MPIIKWSSHGRLFLAVIALAVAAPGRASSPAKALIAQAIEAQGGEQALRSAGIVEWSFQGYRNMIEQSERPEGPPIPEFRTVHEFHDYSGGRFNQVMDRQFLPEFQAVQRLTVDRSAAVRSFDDQKMAASPDTIAAVQDLLALSPERLLLTALDAPDLRLSPEGGLQSVPQDVLRFTINGSPATLYLNRYTHLPTALDYRGPAAQQDFWHYGGDFTMRTLYGYWWIGEGGIRLPLQWDIYRNSIHDMTLMVSGVRLKANPDASTFAISPDMRAAFAKQANAGKAVVLKSAMSIAPGVSLLPGSWNVGIIRQSDGIVILEAPISSDYSEAIIAESQRLYPGLPIKAVVTTSDAWPHIAGLRPYVARGVPIYAFGLNLPILNRLAKASFTSKPDRLAANPRTPHFVPVADRTTIGSDVNRIDLYPLRGETSERQMMAYLPGLRLLYASDPFQPNEKGGYRTLQAVSEVIDAVEREDIHPDRFYLMHAEAAPWADLIAAAKSATYEFPKPKD